MTTPASYIFSSYSFIHSLPKEQLLQVGNLPAEGSPIPSFDESLLIQLCEDAAKVFQKDDNIIELEGDAIVVGDIHGSFHDLLRILKHIENLNLNCKVIFLGDYVDRGNFSLECITLLFALKILEPTTYYLLRGNHEFNEMCSQYGFKKEILNFHDPKKTEITTSEQTLSTNVNEIDFDLDVNKKKSEFIEDTYFYNHINMNCYKYTEKLYDALIQAFSYLPICAIINKTSICLHGGLSPLLDKVENINSLISRPILTFDENELLSDLLWGDPCEQQSSFYRENQRGRGKLFNGVAIVNFLRNNNLKHLIRGHECVNDGVEQLFNEKCFTVFSASSYNFEMGNSSGILKINQKNDIFEPIIFPPIGRLKKCDANYYKVQPFDIKKTNRPPMIKISEHQSSFPSSVSRINSAYSELLFLPRFHRQTSPNNEENGNNAKCDIIPKRLSGRRGSIHIIRTIPSLKSGPRRKSTVLNAPCILTPQINHQNSELPNQHQPII